ncbi:competence/damage-inducible protein A [Saccharibacter sp. 17.LH.SD]|uniref:competence/damage-inducible protein A n=1 Tax=Saccharibacter sp. 17.LH.SD TaxID=2689393 RepID=UPI001367D928|nr:competence/damage-inducible protein A [Saccharibacter sp. 17.LH.SD]MXV44073.1 competence/damage-inducible protein A [Saccharibacter sp. 17.LH.SD]
MSPKAACFVVIGNEILSGRTQETNTQVLAHALNNQGIRLAEVRIIPDQREIIITTVSECRARFDFVFTSGGIGPTHDDITTSCIAEAFGVGLVCHEESFQKLKALFKPDAFNETRQRMAWLPEGASPIENSVSTAPGFSLGNVHVMAGVPRIFAAMVQWLVPQLSSGSPLISRTWYAENLYEGEIAQGLTLLQSEFPTIDLGSYPFERQGRHGVALVAKGYDATQVENAGNALQKLIAGTDLLPIEGEPALSEKT